MTDFKDTSFLERVDFLGDVLGGPDANPLTSFLSHALAVPMAGVSLVEQYFAPDHFRPDSTQDIGEVLPVVPFIKDRVAFTSPIFSTSSFVTRGHTLPRSGIVTHDSRPFNTPHNRPYVHWSGGIGDFSHGPRNSFSVPTMPPPKKGRGGRKSSTRKSRKKTIKRASKSVAKRIVRFKKQIKRAPRVSQRLRQVSAPSAVSNVGYGGHTLRYLPTTAPGCIRIAGRLRIAKLYLDGTANQVYFRLSHNGSTTDTQQLIIAPYNSLYFPDQIVKLTRMFQQFAINTKLEFCAGSSTGNNDGVRMGHTFDATSIFGYGTTLTMASNVPTNAMDAQAHQQETTVWKGRSMQWMKTPANADMKLTSFPTITAVPDAAYTYTDSDVDEKVTFTWTPQVSDIRNSTAGAYWLVPSQADVSATGERGTFYLHYEMLLCDMTVSTAGFKPNMGIDISTVDYKHTNVGRNVINVPKGHPACDFLKRKNSTAHSASSPFSECKDCGSPSNGVCMVCKLIRKVSLMRTGSALDGEDLRSRVTPFFSDEKNDLTLDFSEKKEIFFY